MFALTPFRFDRGLSPAAHRKAIRDMDEIFDRLLWAPDLAGSRDLKDYDMYEKDGKLYLSIEAPGVDPDCMEVMITKDRVSVRCKGSDGQDEKAEDGKIWYSKKCVTCFNLDLTLPFEINSDAAEAFFEHGMLQISAPRLQVSEGRVIPVKKI